MRDDCCSNDVPSSPSPGVLQSSRLGKITEENESGRVGFRCVFGTRAKADISTGFY